jgi:hypothetical protein
MKKTKKQLLEEIRMLLNIIESQQATILNLSNNCKFTITSTPALPLGDTPLGIIWQSVGEGTADRSEIS